MAGFVRMFSDCGRVFFVVFWQPLIQGYGDLTNVALLAYTPPVVLTLRVLSLEWTKRGFRVWYGL